LTETVQGNFQDGTGKNGYRKTIQIFIASTISSSRKLPMSVYDMITIENFKQIDRHFEQILQERNKCFDQQRHETMSLHNWG